MKRMAIIAGLLCLIIFCPNAWAGLRDVDIDLSVGYLDGDNTYEIGGTVIDPAGSEILPFPISRLEFPLNAAMINAQINMDLTPKWMIGVRGQTNIADTTEKMMDSDWVFAFGDPDFRYIYSESDAKLKIWDVDLFSRYTLYKTGPASTVFFRGNETSKSMYSFFVGLGFRYQDLSYDVDNVLQWYPLYPWAEPFHYKGLALTYDLKLSIPYAEIGVGYEYGESFSLDIACGFSVFVHASDEDHHILRDMVSTMDSKWDGNYLGGSINARYLLSKHWFLSARVEGNKVTVEGPSHTRDLEYGNYTIDEKVETSQASGYIGVGYDF